MKRIIILAILATILGAAPAPAQSQSRWDSCRRIPHGRNCRNVIDGRRNVLCDPGYRAVLVDGMYGLHFVCR